MNKTKIDWADMTWNPVPNFPGYYAAQSGQILSLKKQKPRIMKPIDSRDGHQYVFMYIDGIQRKIWVHRAVLSAWKGQPKQGEEGRHLDDNPTNNNIHNLEWGTRIENVNDKRINGGLPTGERSGTHVLTAADVVEIRKIYGKSSLRKIARQYGVSHTAIRRAALGIKWACIREELS